MNDKLFEFIKKCPTAFHAVDAISNILEKNGFIKLKEDEAWGKISLGGKFYVTRNDSSIIAFSIGDEKSVMSYRCTASHCDSPSFKIKENAQLEVRDKYIQLNTEGYGGMICYSWMDRPLGIAGRVVVKEDGKLVSKTLDLGDERVVIPSLAVHMNRDVNKGVEFNKQTDMLPLLAMKTEDGITFADAIQNGLRAQGIEDCKVMGKDLFLYNPESGVVWGANKEFISVPRLDDLMCAYASLMAFLDSKNKNVIKVYACFDNEEVGSDTLQGAGSSFFQDTLERISEALGYSKDEYHRALAGSLMLSEDNGHAVHPNHPEKTDANNCVYMNGGIVVKSHAGQKYATDGIGVAICRDISENNQIPIQFFANRSDQAGGSTLGNIAACKVPIRTIDIGLAQLAMHSSMETAGAKDVAYMKQFSEKFYEYDLA